MGLRSKNVCDSMLARLHADLDSFYHDINECEELNMKRAERIKANTAKLENCRQQDKR